MPPKKKTAAKASATPAKSGTASETFTAHGKEYESTAAATRPTRKRKQADPMIPSTDPAWTWNPDRKITPSTVKYNGRANAATADDAPKTRPRGRPPKNATAPAPAPAASAATTKKRGRPAAESTVDEPPKKRGRPAKSAATAEPAKKRGRPAKTSTSSTEPPKKRGRPAKVGKRGRPAKIEADADAVPPEGEQPTPKKRGRPPKGGETTKIDEDDEDAAEQLEEELLDAAEDEEEETIPEPQEATSRKRKAAAPKKGKAKKNDAAEVELDETAAASGKQYWLMKAEQDGHDETLKNGEVFNTKFTIDDLRAKDSPEPWDGVRNPGAAANLRAMKQGDLAFFYASGGKSPGIVGVMEIVSEHEPDKTAWEENSYGYVEKDKDRKKWCVVHVEYRKKLIKPVSRNELKKHVGEGGPLAKMQEFNAARLSVSKVSEAEWNFINSLVEGGFEEDDENALPGAEEDVIDTKAIIETSTTTVTEKRNGDIVVNQNDEETEIDLPTLPNGFAPAAVMTSTEPEITTTDTLFPSGLPSSRPTSRPASRAGSLAPPGKTARARSRSKTPLARGSSAQPETATVVEGAMPAIQE